MARTWLVHPSARRPGTRRAGKNDVSRTTGAWRASSAFASASPSTRSMEVAGAPCFIWLGIRDPEIVLRTAADA